MTRLYSSMADFGITAALDDVVALSLRSGETVKGRVVAVTRRQVTIGKRKPCVYYADMITAIQVLERGQ